jgi:hypothetical protein
MAPPWRAGAVSCPPNPLASVHDPGRLLLVSPCSTISGEVRHLKIDPVNGELEVFLNVDKADLRYLRPGNIPGTLVARVSVRTIPTLTASALHGEAVLYGAWVVNRARNAAELYPAYAIVPVTPGVTHTASQTPTSAGETPITLTMTAPVTTPTGGELTIRLHAQRQDGHREVAVSQLHALVQISGPSGAGVRWRAAVTNTRGNAYIRMVLLQPPGQYLVTVFGYKGSATATATSIVKVTGS